MPQQSGNNGRTHLEDRLQQGKDRLRQLMPRGPRGPALLVTAILVALVAWTTYYTVPSDSVAVVQRFGKYLKNVPPGLHFKLPLGIDVATIVPGQTAAEAGVRFHDPGRQRSVPEPSSAGRKAGNPDGDGGPERRAGGVGGSIPHLGPGQVPVRGSGTE